MTNEEESGNVAPSASAVKGKSAGAQPEWVLVPREPTMEMLAAPHTVIHSYGASLVYARMLSAAPPAPSAWLPIESAPKDGDCFLGLQDDGAIYSVCVFYKGQFESADDGTPRASLTHWQPLPPPPEKTA